MCRFYLLQHLLRQGLSFGVATQTLDSLLMKADADRSTEKVCRRSPGERRGEQGWTGAVTVAEAAEGTVDHGGGGLTAGSTIVRRLACWAMSVGRGLCLHLRFCGCRCRRHTRTKACSTAWRRGI